jgi:hypothetical protein
MAMVGIGDTIVPVYGPPVYLPSPITGPQQIGSDGIMYNVQGVPCLNGPGPLQPGQVYCDTGAGAMPCLTGQGPLQPGQVFCATGTTTPPDSGSTGAINPATDVYPTVDAAGNPTCPSGYNLQNFGGQNYCTPSFFSQIPWTIVLPAGILMLFALRGTRQ